MRLFNYLFDSGYVRHVDIMERLRRRSRSLVKHANRMPKNLDHRLDELHEDMASLVLTNRALLSLLKEKGVFSPEEFSNKIEEIDKQDGMIDGEVDPWWDTFDDDAEETNDAEGSVHDTPGSA